MKNIKIVFLLLFFHINLISNPFLRYSDYFIEELSLIARPESPYKQRLDYLYEGVDPFGILASMQQIIQKDRKVSINDGYMYLADGREPIERTYYLAGPMGQLDYQSKNIFVVQKRETMTGMITSSESFG